VQRGLEGLLVHRTPAVSSASPASRAIWPADCGGMTLTTAPLTSSPKLVSTVIVDGSTATTAASGPGCHSIKLSSVPKPYRRSQPWVNRPCLENFCLLSRIRPSTSASTPSGTSRSGSRARRAGRAAERIRRRRDHTTPPSSMASSWLRRILVCSPAFQAWGIFSALPRCSPRSCHRASRRRGRRRSGRTGTLPEAVLTTFFSGSIAVALL
jgi:hypothetical protein